MYAHVVPDLVSKRVVRDAIHIDEAESLVREVERQLVHQVSKAAKTRQTIHDNAGEVRTHAIANRKDVFRPSVNLFVHIGRQLELIEVRIVRLLGTH